MDYSFREIVTAILGSAGAIGGLLTIANFVAQRLDKRRERQLQDISVSADARRVTLEEDKHSESVWEGVAKERSHDIDTLTAKLDKAHQQLQEARLTFNRLEDIFRKLRVAKMPDEAVDILNEKLAAAYKAIVDGRDRME